MSGSTRAIFLSYASEDANAAETISAALRAAGLDVFFDRDELRGGDIWDSKIRRQIQDCALFLPIVSRHTQARLEGYFRLEWKLAVDRSHLMAAERMFFVPVVIDDTRDQDAVVPDAFRAVQWTRLPGGVVPPAFVERVNSLLNPATPGPKAGTYPAAPQGSPLAGPGAPAAPGRGRGTVLAVGAGILAVVGLALGARLWMNKSPATPAAATPAAVARDASTKVFNPPPHSVAVLPFLNLSGEKDQEYFSDGLTEELLNALAEVSELQVAARTSSFAFKGQEVDIGTIARRLNVAAVLEGSVRRSGNTVRVTAQLINAVTGYHLWSHTYDHGVGDVLKLQTEIASAVASAMKVSLLGEASSKIELGGTRNPAAFDAYLRARKSMETIKGNDDFRRTLADLDEAIRLDPSFAQAVAVRSDVWTSFASNATDTSTDFLGESMARARADARRAIELAPSLAEAHLALAYNLEVALRYAEASREYEQALALGPQSAVVLRLYATFNSRMGRAERAIEMARRTVVLDPLNRASHGVLAGALYFARRYPEAIAAYQDSQTLVPLPVTVAEIGVTHYLEGEFGPARTSCEAAGTIWFSRWCLAMVYEKLGRHADADQSLTELRKALGDTGAYQYVTIYAQWGDRAKALEWLDTAVRLRDPGLEYLKTEPLLDPIRGEARFQAVLREQHFPD